MAQPSSLQVALGCITRFDAEEYGENFSIIEVTADSFELDLHIYYVGGVICCHLSDRGGSPQDPMFELVPGWPTDPDEGSDLISDIESIAVRLPEVQTEIHYLDFVGIRELED